MSKLRIFYDKDGKILHTEYRPDQDYNDKNIVSEEMRQFKWLIVTVEELGESCIDDYMIRKAKLIKK